LSEKIQARTDDRFGIIHTLPTGKTGSAYRKVSGNCPDAVWRISYSFMTAGEDGSGRRMMGGQEMGRDGRLGRMRCRGKGKE